MAALVHAGRLLIVAATKLRLPKHITFKVTGLSAGETRTFDVASAMLPGNDNVISISAHGGGGGGSALVMVSN
jgi:hypothetical protein